MGRTEKSQGLAPPAVRKDVRAKQARHIINKIIPAILLSNSRARQGAENSQLIANPGATPLSNTIPEDTRSIDGSNRKQRKADGRGKAKNRRRTSIEDDSAELEQLKRTSISSSDSGLKDSQPPLDGANKDISIKIVCTDSLSAAAKLAISASKPNKKQANVCVLNMASPLRPGGGVLNGATSQEEFLCARTTLLPSLKESFYRLPEVGGIFTHDVLVFRDSRPLQDPQGEISTGNRYWIDVISAGMLRFPELQGEDPEDQHWNDKDQKLAEAKMMAVLRIAASHGTRKLVLGAWGCGAYGNPAADVAETWKKVLLAEKADNRSDETQTPWSPIEEVLFAISNRTMAQQFADTFDLPLHIESGSGTKDEGEQSLEDQVVQELSEKIEQLQVQISRAQYPGLKSRLQLILRDLEIQLQKRKEHDEEEDELEDE